MTAPRPPQRKSKFQHTVGNMDALPRTKRVRSVGRNSSRVYCGKCGAKKKDGRCPRGHPA